MRLGECAVRASRRCGGGHDGVADTFRLARDGRNLPTIAPSAARGPWRRPRARADKKPAAAAAALRALRDVPRVSASHSWTRRTSVRRPRRRSRRAATRARGPHGVGRASALSVEENSATGTDHGPEGEKEVDGGAAAVAVGGEVGRLLLTRPPAGYMPPDKSRALPDIKCKRSRTLETPSLASTRECRAVPGTHAAPAPFGARCPAPTALCMPGPRPGAGPSRKRRAKPIEAPNR